MTWQLIAPRLCRGVFLLLGLSDHSLRPGFDKTRDLEVTTGIFTVIIVTFVNVCAREPSAHRFDSTAAGPARRGMLLTLNWEAI